MLGVMMLVVIGSVGFTLMQLQLAPVAQQRAEATQYTNVEADFQQLSHAVSTASQGSSSSAVIEMGVNYPHYLVLIQPPGPTGVLHTGQQSQMRLNNVHSPNQDVQDAIQNNQIVYSTAPLEYRPSYNQFQPPPQITLSGGLLYTQYQGGTTVLDGQSLVNGRQISLTTLNSSISVGKREPLSVQTRPLSASTQTVPITGNGQSLTLTLHSQMSTETWKQILAQQYDRDNSGCSYDSDTAYICEITKPSSDRVRLTFEHRTEENPLVYHLAASLVEVRTIHQPLATNTPAANYTVHVSTANPNVPWNGSANLVVQVRDRYGNPVSQEVVTAEIVTSGSNTGYLGQQPGTTTVEQPTRQNGQVSFRYTAPPDPKPSETNTKTVEVEVWFGSQTDAHKVTFTINVQG